ncbi:MAG: nucleotidyl transferase AbiEii/AbiGii toxin family protein [Proteobacteria bacterium]|nr:nucleotidyl transferase AbiEii/AbiGii toxin family protein [Pseudomonadota bacterium]
MKSYDQNRIRQSELLQLIILHTLFSDRRSKNIIFQGGTAIRWFYGGLRFSEDLDFVVSLPYKELLRFVNSVMEPLRRMAVANFGTGALTFKEKDPRDSSYRTFVDFSTAATRNKTSVKIEFERLLPEIKPAKERKIMQASPAVSYLFREGALKMPGAAVMINIETPEEILSDKLRALLERPYTKGRDFFDVWYLTKTLLIEPDSEVLKRKLDMYEAPFSVSTPVSFYTNMEELEEGTKKTLISELHRDLARFLDGDTLKALAGEGYRELIVAVQDAFRKIHEAGIIDFDIYPGKQRKIS